MAGCTDNHIWLSEQRYGRLWVYDSVHIPDFVFFIIGISNVPKSSFTDYHPGWSPKFTCTRLSIFLITKQPEYQKTGYPEILFPSWQSEKATITNILVPDGIIYLNSLLTADWPELQIRACFPKQPVICRNLSFCNRPCHPFFLCGRCLFFSWYYGHVTGWEEPSPSQPWIIV